MALLCRFVPGQKLQVKLQRLDISTYTLRNRFIRTISDPYGFYDTRFFRKNPLNSTKLSTFTKSVPYFWNLCSWKKENSNVIIKNSSFSKNSANVGGAVYVDSSTAVISTSTFADNTAKSGEGGAIYSSKWTHIENSTFLRNTADAKGGAIYTNYIQFGQNVFFINNTAKDHGGAVYTDYISNNICNINFNGNKVTADFGGAIYINKKSGNVYFINSTFISNSATAGDGGAIYSDSGSTNIILINSIFKNNHANGGKEKRYGGAIRCCNRLTVDNCTFIDNWAENLGGAIYTNTIDSIKNSVFISNHAKEGGAIYVNNKCSMSITNSYFNSNKATDGRGGAIYTDSKSTSLTINNNAIRTVNFANITLSRLNGSWISDADNTNKFFTGVPTLEQKELTSILLLPVHWRFSLLLWQKVLSLS